MPHTVRERVRRWALDDDAEADYLSIHEQIDYLADALFSEYEPTKGAGYPEFRDRLRDWLNSALDESDQKLLLQLVPHLFFVGTQEVDCLYQQAFNGPTARWLADLSNIQLDDPQAQQHLLAAVQQCWFCPVTDSMQIAKFYHVNNISGADLRPDWQSLSELGDANKITQYMAQHDPPLHRLVLLEDFVGTGDQMASAVEFAANLPTACPVLLCPVFICPEGSEKGRQIQCIHPHVRFDPVVELGDSHFLRRTHVHDEPALFARLRNLLCNLYPDVMGTAPTQPLYGPFGYKHTGALAIMYTNCSDNVPPIVHHNSENWRALFPRSSRL